MEKKKFDAVINSLKNSGAKTAAGLKELLSASDSKAPKADCLSARGRLEALFDEGTFMECGTFVRRSDGEDAFEAVITGWGSISGRLCFAFSQDFQRSHGALTKAHAEKIAKLYRLAVENGAPVIGMFDSAGAYIPEGAKVLGGYAEIIKAVSKASGVIPQIAVIPGICSGSAAVAASMMDFIVISEKSGRISFNAPFAVNEEKVGSSEFAAKSGLASLTGKNDGECIALCRELLSYLPMNNAEGTVIEAVGDDVNRLVDLSDYSGDASLLIKAVADNGKYFELNALYAPEMTVGFISLGGTVCGIVANRKSENGGILTACAARKASKMISFCDAFDIPVITVVDSEGADTTASAEASAYAAELSKLAFAYTSAKCPLITLIAGEAYGVVFSVMGSKGVGADVVLALENAKIGTMKADRAVAFLWNDKISAAASRKDLEALWNETEGSPACAAASGEIDDIISDSEARQRIAGAVMMLSAKSTVTPSRRHADMPL